MIWLLPLLVVAVKPKKVEPPEPPKQETLVGILGETIYDAVDKPKYHFYMRMTIGNLDRETVVTFVTWSCNVIYGSLVTVGFLVLPRTSMLIFTLLTLYVGPAMVLVVLGCCGGVLAAFALYPVTSVAVVWLVFFVKSKAFQALGLYYGLDADKDGDVDWLDVVEVLGRTKIGKVCKLDVLHNALNQKPFQEEVLAKLHEIEKKVE